MNTQRREENKKGNNIADGTKIDKIMKTGLELIADERKRQIDVKGYNQQHDSQHNVSEFISAAKSYITTAGIYAIKQQCDCTDDGITNGIDFEKRTYVWGYESFNPKDCISDLVKAGALIAAAIDRLQLKEQ